MQWTMHCDVAVLEGEGVMENGGQLSSGFVMVQVRLLERRETQREFGKGVGYWSGYPGGGLGVRLLERWDEEGVKLVVSGDEKSDESKNLVQKKNIERRKLLLKSRLVEKSVKQREYKVHKRLRERESEIKNNI